MHRRKFFHRCLAGTAAAAIPLSARNLLAAELADDDRKISVLEVVKATGKTQQIEGIDRQYQVQPIHLYGPPQEYRDAENPRKVEGTAERLFLRIRTRGGLEGMYGTIDADALPLLFGSLRRVVVGQDALAVESLWDRMYRADRLGRSGRYMKGISYIDNALWDLRGRYFRVPVFQLLGGPTRNEVRVYGSCLGYSVQPESAAKRCVQLRDQGFIHQKWFLAYGPASSAEGLRRNIELVRVLRESLGDGIDIMFDAYQGWDLQYALAWAGQAEPFRPAWIEEAFPMADLESYIQFSQRTSIPVATGEHFSNRWEVQQFLKVHAIQIVQADPEWCGGVSELVKICHLASVHGAKVIPHGHNIHAALHVVASQSPAVCPLVEYLINHVPSKQLFQKHPLLTENGVLALPTRPGFGIELDEGAIEDLKVITNV